MENATYPSGVTTTSPGTFRPIDTAREVFPDNTDRELAAILWDHTGYPEWWDLREGENVQDCLRRQLTDYRDGRCQCIGCGSILSEGKSECHRPLS